MGICGVVGRSATSIERPLAALRIGSRRADKRLRLEAAEIGACDDAALAQDAAGAVLFDGRIDNKDELRRALDLPAECSDGARIALAAARKWGEDFSRHLIGDYACAAWFGRTQRLVMTTDPGALRPLFFWTDGARLLFASEQRGLWADPDVPRVLDRTQMATWLAMLPREPLRTFFQDVCRVPPGHKVTWAAGRVQLERWWHPEALPTLRLKRDEDYEELLLETLSQAVSCRILPGERIGSRLSGGLDSTSVTALAARRLAQEGRRLTAFTAAPARPAPEEAGMFVDEWPKASLVAQRYPNIDHVRIDNDDGALLDALALREAANDWPVLNATNTVWINAIDRQAAERGVEVMLVGSNGNMTISFNGCELLASQIRGGNIARAFKTTIEMRRGGRRSWLSIANEAARSILPAEIFRRARKALGKSDVGLFDFSPANPSLFRDHDIEERAMAMAGELRNGAVGDARALRLSAMERADHRGHWAAGTRRLFGIDTRDPTGDRRVIELCLSIPEEQYALRGVPRSLIRRTMRGILPDAILEERRYGRQAADWRTGFDAAVPELKAEVARLRNSPAAAECLDLDRLDALLDAWSGPNDPSAAPAMPYLWAFGRGLTAGRFLRRLEGGNA